LLLQAIVVIVLPRPGDTFLHGRLDERVSVSTVAGCAAIVIGIMLLTRA